VTLVATYGNVGNDGEISWNTEGGYFGWLPPQADLGNAMEFQFVDANGRYRIHHDDGDLVFDVDDYDALDAGDDIDADTIIVENIVGALFDEVLDAELTSGTVDYRCIYLRNHHTATTITGVALTIDNAADVGVIEFGLDDNFSAGASGDDAQTALPPTIDGSWDDTLIVTDIGPGEHVAVWIRRTIAAASERGDNPVANSIRFTVTY